MKSAMASSGEISTTPYDSMIAYQLRSSSKGAGLSSYRGIVVSCVICGTPPKAWSPRKMGVQHGEQCHGLVYKYSRYISKKSVKRTNGVTAILVLLVRDVLLLIGSSSVGGHTNSRL